MTSRSGCFVPYARENRKNKWKSIFRRQKKQEHKWKTILRRQKKQENKWNSILIKQTTGKKHKSIFFFTLPRKRNIFFHLPMLQTTEKIRKCTYNTNNRKNKWNSLPLMQTKDVFINKYSDDPNRNRTKINKWKRIHMIQTTERKEKRKKIYLQCKQLVYR